MSILISFVRARATMRIHPKNSIAQRPNILTVFVPYYRITQMKCKCVGNVLVYDINFAHRIFTTFSATYDTAKQIIWITIIRVLAVIVAVIVVVLLLTLLLT